MANVMDEVIQLFCKLRDTSGRNDKINIIRNNKDNERFIDDLVFLLDSNVITGISTTKLNKNIGVIGKLNFEDELSEVVLWYKLKNWLLSHPTGSNQEISACQKFINSVPEDHKDYYRQMVTKKLKTGCDYKTANEAIPGLLYVYETQQAFPISDKNRPKPGEWFSLSEKLNGINGGFINGKCLSRQGKEISGMQHIIDELMALGIDTNKYYVNGELIRDNIDNIPDEENFRLSTSIINSDSAYKGDISLVFYEVIPIDQFYGGKSTLTYKDRLARYEKLSESIKEIGLKHVKFVDHYYSGTDQSKIQEWLNYADSHNKEGIMLNKDTVWQNKRNNGILKVKTFHTCDIRCTGVTEGDGKYKGTLGNITCDYKGTDLGVGSGFSDSQRDYYWTHKDEIIGKIVTVKYKAITRNMNNNSYSLQFPIFQGVRKDKDEESYED